MSDFDLTPTTRFLKLALPAILLIALGGYLTSRLAPSSSERTLPRTGPTQAQASAESVGSLHEDGTDPDAPSLAESAASALHDAGFVTINDTIRRGDTLSGVLLRNRLAIQEIGRIRQLVREKDLFSPRSLRPGQVLELARDDYGRFQHLRFEMSPEDVFLFSAVGDSLVGERVEVDRHVRLRKLAGTVHSSFDEAIRGAGGDYRLTLEVSDVLAYDVDFFTDVRRGDRFELLVEERFVEDRFLGYGEIVYAAYEGERTQCEAVHYSWADEEMGGHYTPSGEAMKKAFLRSPLNFRRISSKFGKRFHPVLQRMRHHSGVDYAADTGTPVQALGDGVIDYRGWKGGYGNTVRIRHNGGLQTLYGHLHRFARGQSRGERVSQGDVIGYVGQTGLATGPHLHFEVIDRGRQIDPLSLKNEPADPIPASERTVFVEWAGEVRRLNDALVTGQVVEPYAQDHVGRFLAGIPDREPGPLR